MSWSEVKKINSDMEMTLDELLKQYYSPAHRFYAYGQDTYTIPYTGLYTIRAYHGRSTSYGKLVGKFKKGEQISINISGNKDVKVTSDLKDENEFLINLDTNSKVIGNSSDFKKGLSIGGVPFTLMPNMDEIFTGNSYNGYNKYDLHSSLEPVGWANIICNNGIACGAGGCPYYDRSEVEYNAIYNNGNTQLTNIYTYWCANGGNAYATGNNVFAFGGGGAVIGTELTLGQIYKNNKYNSINTDNRYGNMIYNGNYVQDDIKISTRFNMMGGVAHINGQVVTTPINITNGQWVSGNGTKGNFFSESIYSNNNFWNNSSYVYYNLETQIIKSLSGVPGIGGCEGGRSMWLSYPYGGNFQDQSVTAQTYRDFGLELERTMTGKRGIFSYFSFRYTPPYYAFGWSGATSKAPSLMINNGFYSQFFNYNSNHYNCIGTSYGYFVGMPGYLYNVITIQYGYDNAEYSAGEGGWYGGFAGYNRRYNGSQTAAYITGGLSRYGIGGNITQQSGNIFFGGNGKIMGGKANRSTNTESASYKTVKSGSGAFMRDETSLSTSFGYQYSSLPDFSKNEMDSMVIIEAGDSIEDF